MYFQHVASNYIKSSYDKVWEAEFDLLDSTCKNKFRKMGDVNQWVIKFWQIAEGNVMVRKKSFAKCYHVKNSNFMKLCEDLKKGKHAMICINDNARTFDFEVKKKIIIDIFEERFPDRCSFEI